MRRIFTTVTNIEFYDILREDSAQGETNWTVSPHVRHGDLIALYVAAPISSIVAIGEATNDAEEDTDPSSVWFRHSLCDIHNLRMLDKPITRKELLIEIPEWRWPRQPRGPALVPPEYTPLLDALMMQPR
jgi:hypothetical protein